jgi:hypothetical protein
MKSEEKEASPTGYFAKACEELNEFARSLSNSSRFGTVTTGADIRYYETGWRLEKWVEAALDKAEELWACWWLEFGATKNGWIIQSNLSITPDGIHIALEDRIADSPAEFQRHLSAVVQELKDALEKNRRFAEEVKKENQFRKR